MSSTDRPDLVFLGATVETMTDDARPADAVAVRDGRIAFVGSSADARPLIGPGTRVIELEGETLLPGFQDAHVHPIEGGMLSRSCDLHDLADAAAYLEAIAAHATAHPDREWITGSGWSLPAFPRGEPHRSLLDAIVSNRPVLLESDDGHVAWANSKALAIGGIDSRDARSGRWPDRPRRGRRTDGHAARLRDRPRLCAMRHRRRTTICSRGCARPSAISTRWGSPAGRTPTSSPMRWPPTATRPRPAGSRRASSRPSGGGARPGSSRSTTSRRSATHRRLAACARTA